MKSFKTNQLITGQNGFILLVVFLVVFLLLLMAMYFFSFIITELKISKNQSIAEQTYYLAEAGVEEAIWKLKNDSAWQNSFETDPDWSATFSRENVFFPDGGYTIQIQNYDYAKAEITSTGTYAFFSGTNAQRVIKIKAFKALNPNPVEDIALFTGDDDLEISGTIAELTNGGLFSNDDIDISFFSNVHTTENASATGNIDIELSTLDADGSEEECSGDNWTACENWPPIVMPMIDFDSTDPDSYKNQAQSVNQVYTQQQFTDMLKNNPNLTLNGITYVTGQVKVKRGQHLTVNGVLATDGSITVGIGWQDPFGTANLIVNNTSGQPSGVLTKGSFKTGSFGGNINIAGLIYASDSVEFDTFLPSALNITGGVIARQFESNSLWNSLNITYDSSIIMTALGAPLYSQVVTVEHWEEQY